jgi:ribose transport system substrate-binding protein
MKKGKIFAVAMMMFCMAGIQVFAGGSRQSAGGSGTYKVGYIVGSREHVFYTLIEKGIKDNAGNNGINAVVMDGNLDGKVTSDHIENFVADGMKAIALSANDPGGTTPAIREAVEHKIPVFTFDCTIEDASLITSFVGTDNVEGGRLAGRETVRLADAGAKVGLINFDNPQSCLDRRKGWEEIVKTSGKNFTIIEVGNYEGDASKAEQLMSDALTQNPDLTVVFCVGDPAAAGALAAIKTAGAKTKIIGFDGNPEAKAALLDPVNGQYWVSEISQNPQEIGKFITQQIKKYLDTGSVDQKVIMVAPYIITKENANQ